MVDSQFAKYGFSREWKIQKQSKSPQVGPKIWFGPSCTGWTLDIVKQYSSGQYFLLIFMIIQQGFDIVAIIRNIRDVEVSEVSEFPANFLNFQDNFVKWDLFTIYHQDE